MKYGPFRPCPRNTLGYAGAIVADHDTGWDDADNLAHYGGHLVCESVPPALQPLLLAAPELLAECERLLARETETLTLLRADPLIDATAQEQRVARLRELVERADGEVPEAPPTPEERPRPLSEPAGSWEEVVGIILGYAEKLRTVALVEDAYAGEVFDALVREHPDWRSVILGERRFRRTEALSRFQQDESARALVLPFRDYCRSVDLSHASVGVIAVSADTAADDARLRQAIGRFERIGGRTREILVLVVREEGK